MTHSISTQTISPYFRCLMAFCFLITLNHSSSNAAESAALVTGRVMDPSGAAVAGATVTISDRDGAQQHTVQAGSHGEFRLQQIPPGEYLLEASASDFGKSGAAFLSLASGETKTLDLTLRLQRLSSRVLVTASGTPQSTEEISKALDVIDSDQMNRREQYSMVDAIRTVPGIRVQQLGGPGSFTRVLTRGLRATDTSLLIDGMRLRDVAAVQGDAEGFLGDLLLINSDRIEVLRGSGSSLYGTHANGGVINLITDQAGGAMHGDLTLDGGGLGLFRGVAKLGGGALHDRLRYSAGLGHLDVTQGVDQENRYRNTSGQGFAQYSFSPMINVTARLFANDSFGELNTNPSAAPATNLPATGFVPAIPLPEDQVRLAERGLPYQIGTATFIPAFNDPDSHRDSNFYSTLIALNHRLSPWAGYRLSYQGVDSSHDNPNGPAGSGFQPLFPTNSQFGGRIDTIQARGDVSVGRYNLVTGGYEWEREYFNTLATDQNPDPAKRTNARATAVQRSNSGFAQDQIRLLANRLQISLSGRMQSFTLDRPVFTGGLPQYAGSAFPSPPNAYTGDGSLAYFVPRSSTKLRAHVGNSYRVPSLYERFGTFFYGGSFSALGDPRLAPERSLSFDAGFDQYFSKDKLRVGGTYFYTRLQQVIGYGSTPADPFGRYSGYLNTGGGLARGVEISVEAKPARGTTVQSSYTYTNARERNSSLVGGTLRSIRYFPHTFSIVGTQQIGPRVQVTATFLAASDYVSGTFFVGTGSRPYLFPGPRKLDLAASYTLPLFERTRVSLFTRAENLLDQTYFEDGFKNPGRWAVAGMKLQF